MPDYEGKELRSQHFRLRANAKQVACECHWFARNLRHERSARNVVRIAVSPDEQQVAGANSVTLAFRFRQPSPLEVLKVKVAADDVRDAKDRNQAPLLGAAPSGGAVPNLG